MCISTIRVSSLMLALKVFKNLKRFKNTKYSPNLSRNQNVARGRLVLNLNNFHRNVIFHEKSFVQRGKNPNKWKDTRISKPFIIIILSFDFLYIYIFFSEKC